MAKKKSVRSLVTWKESRRKHPFDTLGQQVQFPLASIVSSERGAAAEDGEMFSL